MLRRKRTIYQTDTEYEYYEVVDMTYEGRPARVLFTNHHRSAQSGLATDGKPELLFDYNQRFLELAESLQPKNVLIIGGGTYTLPMALMHSLPVRVDVVEPDAGLDEVAQRFFGFTPHSCLDIIHTDGRRYLDTTTRRYDLIIIDAFYGAEVPYEFLTIQAALASYRALATEGIVAMNTIGIYHHDRSMQIKSLLAAYHGIFGNIRLHPADDSISPLVSQNFILISRKGIPSRDFNISTRPIFIPSTSIENLLFDQSANNSQSL